MTDINLDDFELFQSRGRGDQFPNHVSFAVYEDRTHGFQLNIKVGEALREQARWKIGDLIEFRYSIGKRQILLSRGDKGFTLNKQGSFRRNINKGWHHEPFPSKVMESTNFEALAVQDDKILIQLPKENEHD